jgi:hypothetical protein
VQQVLLVKQVQQDNKVLQEEMVKPQVQVQQAIRVHVAQPDNKVFLEQPP